MNKLLLKKGPETTGLFRTTEFPELMREIAEIKERMSPIACANKTEMIISFARNHQIQASLVRMHPEIVKILISKGTCLQLETVYMAYKGQSDFVRSLELYLAVHFNT